MIYVTGDTHGSIDRFRQFKKLFPKYRDFLLVCGDFGFVWNGSEQERSELSKLEKYACNILFVEGTHDNLDALSTFPLEHFRGGMARRLAKNVFWLQRGNVYDIDGVKIFAFGGGESFDADEREEGVNWWRNELATVEEIEAAKSALQKAGNSVDIVLTHQDPRLELGLVDHRSERINAPTAFLGELARTLSFKHWYFGMHHVDRTISPKMTALFEKIVPYKP